VPLREYHEYFLFLRKYVLNAIWYGGLLAQQLRIDIAMQMREHSMEFYKSKQQQMQFKKDSYKTLTDYCNTKAQRQASSRDEIVNFTLNSISSCRSSSTMGFTSFYVMRQNDPRCNDPATK
jgi:hypothetical protein